MNAIGEVEKLLDADEVGARLGVSHWSVRSWSRDGRFIPATMIGNQPRWRERDVNAWIVARAAAQQTIEATAAKAAQPRKPRGKRA